MSVQVNVHGLDRKVYDALPVPEQSSGGFVWRTISAGACIVTFFPEHAEPSPEEGVDDDDADLHWR